MENWHGGWEDAERATGYAEKGIAGSMKNRRDGWVLILGN